MNNYLAMNICEAIMPIKDDSVNVTIITNSGNVYNNVEVNDFDTKGVYFSNDKYALYVAYDKIVEINVSKAMVINKVSDIDYEDIYDNINDYEYPYNHINRSDL